jgi:uncharacterized damage-inducible protein DinB
MTSRPQADDHLPEKRAVPPPAGDERDILTGFLEYHRQTVLLKCAGLTPEQLLLRATPPSSLCLLGLVRHLTEVEYGWLAERFAGGEVKDVYGEGDADFDIVEADEQSVAAAFARYAAQVAESRQIVAAADLDAMTAAPHERTGEHFSLRCILVHMIEEYARHNGHADLLREAIDGAIGE